MLLITHLSPASTFGRGWVINLQKDRKYEQNNVTDGERKYVNNLQESTGVRPDFDKIETETSKMTNQAELNVCSKERFMADIENHEMTVLRDDGLYRYIQFKQPGKIAYHFELVTWPGYLTICGDMGSYTFRRISDMFDFFNGPGINPHYWREKLQAVDRNSGCLEYSQELFEEAVKADFEEWEFETPEQKGDVWCDLEREVACHHDTLDRAHDAAYHYESKYGHRFEDFWDHDLKRYTLRYIWCLHAIVHGIAEYKANAKDAS